MIISKCIVYCVQIIDECSEGRVNKCWTMSMDLSVLHSKRVVEIGRSVQSTQANGDQQFIIAEKMCFTSINITTNSAPERDHRSIGLLGVKFEARQLF
jgi:hypothetical protein